MAVSCIPLGEAGVTWEQPIPWGFLCVCVFDKEGYRMPDKVAILIDGGFYLRRLRYVRNDIDDSNPERVALSIGQLVNSHLRQINEVYRLPNHRQLLYRCFFYDALPYLGKAHHPVSKRAIDYAKTEEAQFRTSLFQRLRRERNLALRLGEVTRQGDNLWFMRNDAQSQLLNGGIQVSDLKDEDFNPNLRQKGVDIRIGLDIATITLKKQANIIVLVSGDSDFVPAARLARREGVTFILDPLWQRVSPELSEHIDLLRSGFSNPQGRTSRDSQSDVPGNPQNIGP